MKLFNRTKDARPANERLGTDPIWPLLLSMAAPSIVAMTMQALYNTVDSMFVARISEGSLAAVTLAWPVQMIMGAMSTGIGVGINSSIARHLGAHDEDGASRAAANGLMLGIFAIVVMALFGIFGAEPFVRFYTTDPEVVAAGTVYIRTISLLATGSVFSQITFSVLQGSGNMLLPMVSQLSGGLAVIALDPIFIFGLNMGVLGAAVASSLAQWISMAIGLFGVLRVNQKNLRVSFAGFHPDLDIIKDILSVGIPSALTQATTSIVSGIVNKLIAGYGTAAVAVYGGFNKVTNFAILPLFGITRGMSPILGYAYGAGNRERFVECERKAGRLGELLTIPSALVLVLFPQLVLAIVNATPEMAEVGNVAIRILGAPICFYGLSIVYTQAFPPAKRSSITMALAIFRQVLLLVPLTNLFSHFMGLTGIWVGIATADALNMVAVLIVTRWLWTKGLASGWASGGAGTSAASTEPATPSDTPAETATE